MASNFLADDDALVGVFTDLHPPGYQEEVQTTEANVQSGSQNEPTPVEFMKHFRPELVTHPGSMTSVWELRGVEFLSLVSCGSTMFFI